MKQYYVYIMSNRSKTLYTGMTSDLERRVHQHKLELIGGFTKRYNLTKLVYYDLTGDVQSAICREKQIKGWLRARKIALIETVNRGVEGLQRRPVSIRGRPFALLRVTETDVILSAAKNLATQRTCHVSGNIMSPSNHGRWRAGRS